MSSRLEKSEVIDTTLQTIIQLRRQVPPMDSLFSSLSALGELTIFGGVIRDLVILADMKMIRDIDIVVSVASDDELLSIFGNVPSRRTRFGGFHCLLDGLQLDVWSLGGTWAFREGLLEPHVRNLPRSAFLSIDAVAVSLAAREIYEDRFFESIERKTIDIVLEKNPFPALCVLRSLVLRRKYNFLFSDSLRSYIREFWNTNENPLRALSEIQISHYGEQILSYRQISDEIEKYV